ncbi:MAG: hypothetical protein R3F19_31550 [Verrucomicrobiales bacterium]
MNNKLDMHTTMTQILYVSLDVHKDSITIASPRKIGTERSSSAYSPIISPPCSDTLPNGARDRPEVFTVLESWESEAFEAHRRAPHVADFKVTCEAMIVEKSGLSLDELAAG